MHDRKIEEEFLERGLAFDSRMPGRRDRSSLPSMDEPKAKKDARLFPHLDLYCEGADKPLMRGVIHLIAALWLLLEGMDRFIVASGNSQLGKFAAVTFVCSNILCYSISALYHIGKWGINVEIFLQKVDHCCIAIFSAGTMFPAALLLLPRHEYGPPLGHALFIFAVGLAVWVCVNIFALRPSTVRQVICAASVVPFVPFLYQLMTTLEFQGMLGCMFFQGLGVLVFTNASPNPIPGIFGYHEVFHVFVTAAGFSAFVCNYSIVSRMCLPGAPELTFSAAIVELFGPGIITLASVFSGLGALSTPSPQVAVSVAPTRYLR
jgi:hemolysin III